MPTPLQPHSDLGGDVASRLRGSVLAVFHGKGDLVLHVLTALLARGHVLLADVPGVGKTTLAQAIATALGCSFHRIQFTADLLPSDIIGVTLWDEGRQEFRFHQGPVFAHVVLADEINRTPPRTQSALLEAMNEEQVTVDGEVHALPAPFLVIATQNPIEHHGTFPLPESQVDRFLMRLEVGYPDPEGERLLLRETAAPRPRAERVLDPSAVAALQARAARVRVHADLEDHVLRVAAETRRHPDLALGVSPRASQGWVRASKARAMLLGRDFVTPDDIVAVSGPVLVHRLVPAAAGRVAPTRPADVLAEIQARVPLPR